MLTSAVTETNWVTQNVNICCDWNRPGWQYINICCDSETDLGDTESWSCCDCLCLFAQWRCLPSWRQERQKHRSEFPPLPPTAMLASSTPLSASTMVSVPVCFNFGSCLCCSASPVTVGVSVWVCACVYILVHACLLCIYISIHVHLHKHTCLLTVSYTHLTLPTKVNV